MEAGENSELIIVHEFAQTDVALFHGIHGFHPIGTLTIAIIDFGSDCLFLCASSAWIGSIPSQPFAALGLGGVWTCATFEHPGRYPVNLVSG